MFLSVSYRRRLSIIVAAFALLVSACSSDAGESSSAAADTTDESSVSTAAVATPSGGGDDSPTVGEWEQVATGEPCQCSDGSPFHYWVRPADPTKVVFFLSGGGACFSAETCGGTDPTFTVNLSDNESPDDGIFDPSNRDNPLSDYTFVVVPYCTGDLHLGTQTHDYGGGLVVNHVGHTNASTVLAAAAERFPDAVDVVVAGSSAGSASAALYGGLAADSWPEADIAVIADASAAYPGTPAITLAIGSLWGTTGGLPTWPATAGLSPEDWSLHALFWNTQAHAPRVRFASYNNAFDEVQAVFSAMIGLDSANLVGLIDETNAAIKARGVDLATWVAPGTDHTILGDDELYEQTVEGQRLIDWLGDFIDGDPVDDVRCTDCGKPA